MGREAIRNMEEFAAVSGISRPTVSKYFHDPESVRISTRTRIEAALEEYDYRPNIYAINQNRKQTKNIGIVVPYLADPFFAEIARGIERLCIDAGFSPTLFSAHGERDNEIAILDSLRSIRPVGVLLAPLGRLSDRSVVEKFCRDIPTVLFDSAMPDLGTTFVGSDNPQFTMAAVDYLCRTGTPPSFFEMQTPANPNAHKRRIGYCDAMESLGHAPMVVSVPGEGWAIEEVGRVGGLAALDAERFATGTILCSNDRLAIGLLSACFERGLKVGRGPDCPIRVMGQDGHPFSRYTCPPLTTIAHDYERVTRGAVDTLLALIDSGVSAETSTLYKGRLVARESA